jgi:hypothetical protein
MRTCKPWWPYGLFFIVITFTVTGRCDDWRQKIIIQYRKGLAYELQSDDPENAVLRLQDQIVSLLLTRRDDVEKYNIALRTCAMSPSDFAQQQLQETIASLKMTDVQIADTRKTLAQLKGRRNAKPARKPSRNEVPEGESDAPIGEQQDNPKAQNNTSGSIRRNDDTRITSDGRINAASASDQLSASSGLPCTEYVANVVAMSGIDVNEKLPGRNYTIKDAINMNDKVLPGAAGDLEYLNDLVRSDPRRSGDEHPTKGVVYALTAANKGVEIDLSSGVSALQRGDLVQYWYLEGNKRRGHAAVVMEPEGDDGKVTLRGSQKGVEGEFRTTLHWAHFKYAVRPNR